jgi:hypothetical protein
MMRSGKFTLDQIVQFTGIGYNTVKEIAQKIQFPMVQPVPAV